MSDLRILHEKLRSCRACPNMCGTPVHGLPNHTAKVMLIGQAPGPHEAALGKPFAYTAGKTLFKWLFEATGLDEETLREHIYFAAVARCFPGKNGQGSGGDREPDAAEIERCREYLIEEIEILRPKLILAVGKLDPGSAGAEDFQEIFGPHGSDREEVFY